MRVIVGPMPCQRCGRHVYYARDLSGVAAMRETDGRGNWVGHYCGLTPYRGGRVRTLVDWVGVRIKGGS